VVAKGLKRICFYISDYGYGHAARDIALIRRIQQAGFAEVFIKTNTAFEFVRRSLPGCTVKKQRNDIGPIYREDCIEVDRDSTEKALDDWVDSWDDHILAEKDFCKENRIDLIISDITPQPFLVAEDLGIPGAGFSNFTWHYIFYSLLGKNSATTCLAEAYSAGDLAMVLPFHEEMGLFKARKNIPLVSRAITISRNAIRAAHGIKDDEPLIYMGVGKSLTSGFFKNLNNPDLKGKKLLVSSDVELPGGIPQENIVRIPSNETESQNYLAMADLVVSKTGYSTASEAIRGRVPVFLFRREGYEEDKLIASGVEKLGIGREIRFEDFVEGRWIEESIDLEKYKEGFDRLDSTFKADGTLDAMSAIREMIL
jgi:UDP:flavonoid glycosyltransferase YjiC (YdhE family)